MKVVFFGTPDFAADCLEFLLDRGIEIVAIVTQPDRPKGRSLQWMPSEVKALAIRKVPHIPILQPEKASSPDFLEKLSQLQADLFVVVVFGQILSQKLLDIPPLGCINVHPSLLPKYRGAAPIQRALMDGVQETGVSIQKIVKQLDAGDVIAFVKILVPEDMTFGELKEKLLELAKPLLFEVICKFENGIPEAEPQDNERATYATKISIEEGEIRWDWPAQKIHNLIRALSPKPGAWCLLQSGKRLKVLRSKLAPGQGLPGEAIGLDGIIACGKGAIQLLEVQPEGKRVMHASDWIRGIPKNIKLFINK